MPDKVHRPRSVGGGVIRQLDSIVGSSLTGAVIDTPYRYLLWRQLSEHGGRLILFIMLNPSTADEVSDDATIRRCLGFSRRWGFNGMLVCNLFAYRATNPRELCDVDEPVGHLNDDWTCAAAAISDVVVGAWGAANFARRRACEVVSQLSAPIHVLGLTKSGAPRHPLYVPATTQLRSLRVF